ncbi:MAG: tetratricopeptide repeat protein, partial [Flavobacteriales bacterium]
LVNTNIDAGDAAGAEKALSDAIKNDPNNKRLYYTIGTIYIDLGENQKAEDALTKALEIDSNYANAQYQLGAHLVGWAGDLNTNARKLKLGDPNYDQMIKQSQDAYGRAVSPLENYISNNPEDKAVLNILFQLHRNLGNSEKALEYKKKAEGL